MTTPRRRWFRFSLGAVLLWFVPYAALLAWIWSPEPPPKPRLDPFGLIAFRDAIGKGIGEEIQKNMTICLTVVWWLAIPVAVWLALVALRKYRALGAKRQP
jgi:hypothetical protein